MVVSNTTNMFTNNFRTMDEDMMNHGLMIVRASEGDSCCLRACALSREIGAGRVEKKRQSCGSSRLNHSQSKAQR